MRPDGFRAAALGLAAALLGAAVPVAGPAAVTGAAPVAVGAAAGPPAGALSDSTHTLGSDSLAARTAVPDSARAGRAAPESTDAREAAGQAPAARWRRAGFLLATRVDLDAARKRAEESLASALPGWRPVLLDPLPAFGTTLGSVRLPDGAAPYRTEDPWGPAESATDRSLVRLGRFGGIAGLAATLDDPEGTGSDVLDDAALSTPVEPAMIRGPADALARLAPESDADALTQPGAPVPRRFRTILVYRKGDGDELVTGARIFSPTIGRGLLGSFSRHAAGGTATISQSVSTRYRVTAGLPKWMNHALSVEGRLFRRAVDMPLAGTEARAEMERASLALRAASRSASRADDVSLTLRRAKRTDVTWPDESRERWEVPELSLKAASTWGDSLGRSFLAGLEAASARVSYRTGADPDFRRRIQSARLTLGARRPLGAGGVGADAAYDLAGRQAAGWDARASGWVAAGRAAARLDLESAMERPTWIDLWTPFRVDTLETDTSSIFFARGGNPSLKARRETGATGFAALDLGGGLRVAAAGAAHHVTHDFGWTEEVAPAAGPIAVTDRALPRGDGWISFASLTLTMSAGPVGARAVGWVRGGNDRLTPRAGSPPSRALDAEAGVRRRLFGGDLLARLSAAAHVLGPRRGLVREPAQAVWDAAMELDFGAAGGVLGFNNVFDRRVGSGVFDVETGLAEPLPGRTFHFGIVWNLLD